MFVITTNIGSLKSALQAIEKETTRYKMRLGVFPEDNKRDDTVRTNSEILRLAETGSNAIRLAKRPIITSYFKGRQQVVTQHIKNASANTKTQKHFMFPILNYTQRAITDDIKARWHRNFDGEVKDLSMTTKMIKRRSRNQTVRRHSDDIYQGTETLIDSFKGRVLENK